jgi:hypothetical protein
MPRSKDLLKEAQQRHAVALAAAMKSGDAAQMEAAMAAFCTDAASAAAREAADDAYNRVQDATILSNRGQVVLTTAETTYYNGIIAAIKSETPKAALESYEVAMPETIIDRVIDNIRKAHPLLDAINFQNVAYMTRIVLNAAPGAAAVWGKITEAITKELNGALKEMSMVQCKLTAFMCISQDLVALGPVWIDRYVVATLSEAIALGLENAIVDGDGKDKPIGMTRTIPDDESSTGVNYARKQAVELAEMTPQAWGPIVAMLAKDPLDENQSRTVDGNDLIFLCNPFDYWEKIMPATTFQRQDGSYARDILPVPAQMFQTSALAKGQAILGIGSNYMLGLGPGGKQGVITPDDSVRFFEDERAYKAKLLGNGRPLDNNSFVLLDISKMLNYVAILTKQVGNA